MARKIKAKMTNPPVGRTDGAGIDHDMWIAWVDTDDNDVNVAHATCVIPNDRFSELIAPMNNAQRANLYRSLIMEFYGSMAVPLMRPTQPSGLNDLSAWDVYLDDLDAFNTELATRTADAVTMSAMATTWIENLPVFDGWPFSFVLQEGD